VHGDAAGSRFYRAPIPEQSQQTATAAMLQIQHDGQNTRAPAVKNGAMSSPSRKNISLSERQNL
jgi:hypothetical protein